VCLILFYWSTVSSGAELESDSVSEGDDAFEAMLMGSEESDSSEERRKQQRRDARRLRNLELENGIVDYKYSGRWDPTHQYPEVRVGKQGLKDRWSEDGDDLFAVCPQCPKDVYKGTSFQIKCDGECQRWFHGKCVQRSHRSIPRDFFCYDCHPEDSSSGDGRRKKKKKKKKPVKKKQRTLQPVVVPDDVIICPRCGVQEDELMVGCDTCLRWHHRRCTDIPPSADLPDEWLCFDCRKDKNLVEQMEAELGRKLTDAERADHEKKAAARRQRHLQKLRVALGRLWAEQQFYPQASAPPQASSSSSKRGKRKDRDKKKKKKKKGKDSDKKRPKLLLRMNAPKMNAPKKGPQLKLKLSMKQPQQQQRPAIRLPSRRPDDDEGEYSYSYYTDPETSGKPSSKSRKGGKTGVAASGASLSVSSSQHAATGTLGVIEWSDDSDQDGYLSASPDAVGAVGIPTVGGVGSGSGSHSPLTLGTVGFVGGEARASSGSPEMVGMIGGSRSASPAFVGVVGMVGGGADVVESTDAAAEPATVRDESPGIVGMVGMLGIDDGSGDDADDNDSDSPPLAL
jgi:hypothetical protein